MREPMSVISNTIKHRHLNQIRITIVILIEQGNGYISEDHQHKKMNL